MQGAGERRDGEVQSQRLMTREVRDRNGYRAHARTLEGGERRLRATGFSESGAGAEPGAETVTTMRTGAGTGAEVRGRRWCGAGLASEPEDASLCGALEALLLLLSSSSSSSARRRAGRVRGVAGSCAGLHVRRARRGGSQSLREGS